MPGFSEIYGNQRVIANLQSAIAHNRVAHCYLLCGADGLGKRSIAKAFAKTLQCESEGKRPCGVCASCKQVENEDHPDVIYVNHEKPTVFSVDDIRDGLNKSIVIKPYKSEKKIYILPDGQLLNASAQNAMLKTIEEPPSYGIILILTNNKEAFLPTILSRCVELDLERVSDQEVLSYLKAHRLGEGEDVNPVLQFAQGNIGRAVSYLQDENYRQMMIELTEVLQRLPEMNMTGIRNAVDTLSVYKDRMELLISQMQLWFKDVLLCKVGQRPQRDSHFVEQQAAQYGFEDITRIFQEIEVFQSRLKVNVNLELSLEMLLLEMQPAKKEKL